MTPLAAAVNSNALAVKGAFRFLLLATPAAVVICAALAVNGTDAVVNCVSFSC